MEMINENIARIQERMASACGRVGRNLDDVVLVGVTKYADAFQTAEAVEAGLAHIGENRIHQAREKFLSIDSACVTKHMIGHLQTNKVKEALEIFDIIQSVDSLKLAQSIERHAENLGRDVEIFIQVNTSKEERKHGIDASDFDALIDKISEFRHTHLIGLMTMAPFVEDEEIIRDSFRKLRALKEGVDGKYSAHEQIEMKYLSMGMSADFEIAIEEGSNMVRIGQAIFNS
jgi:PLP dependent protein